MLLRNTVLAVALYAMLAACLQSCGAIRARPTLDGLRSATISGIAGQPIILKDGVYEGPPFQPGGASRLRVALWADPVAFGELDGLPGESAAALLSAGAGGSASDVHVAVFQTRNGRLVNAGIALVGDRIKVRSLNVVDRTLAIDVVETGPGDAVCCPRQLARKSYAFRDGRLTLVASVVSGPLSVAALAGPEWTLVSLDEQPLPAGARPPTLLFNGTRVSGFGGCNRYMGQVEERTPGAIILGPLAATKMACPSPAMQVEDRYLALLGRVAQYTFSGGRLVLSGVDGGSRPLVFERRP